MAGLRKLLSLAVGVALAGLSLGHAKPAFSSSELEEQGSEMLFCDLDGDHLKDAVLVDGLNLSIFYQHSKQGFPRKLQQQFRVEERPCLIWPARLGGLAESLLVMTSDGVTELCFTNRTSPPARRQIIKQKTIVPESLSEPQALYFPLSTSTGTDWPLLVVPVADGLQVWQHREEWRQSEFIEHAVDAYTYPSVTNPGYAQSFGVSLNLSDVNGDGREDLIVRRNLPSGMQAFAVYVQAPDGLFNLNPVLAYTNKAEFNATLCWLDLNRDGRIDLIKSAFLNEPFFVPGLRSGKVFVQTYLADESGHIPAEPRQVFRKNDWSSASPMVDIDGDGFVDLVLGYIPIDTREGFRKLIATETISLNLKFHFYRPGSGFPTEPDFQRDTALHFHREFLFNPERRLYYEVFLTLNGDFNGDGKKDLLVRDRGNEISVYFFISREKGFRLEPDFRFHCPEPIDWWEVMDLNGDGVSDLMVKARGKSLFRVFTSQGR